jgi:hypothetical protein
MSAKTILKSFKIMSAGDMSQATLTSIPTEITILDDISFQFNFTGTPTGTFNIQVSADYEPGRAPNMEPANAGNWVNLPFSPALSAGGSAGSVFVDIVQTGASYIRATYTKTSGTGSLDILVTGKAI